MPCCPPLIFRGTSPQTDCPTFGFWLLPNNSSFDAGIAQVDAIVLSNTSFAPPANATATIENGGNTLDIKAEFEAERKCKVHLEIYQLPLNAASWLLVGDFVLSPCHVTHVGLVTSVTSGSEFAVFVRSACCARNKRIKAKVTLRAKFIC
jgi:hypothetical protein